MTSGVLGPDATLRRGYSITMNERGKIIRTIAEVRPKMEIRTRVSDGEFSSEICESNNSEPKASVAELKEALDSKSKATLGDTRGVAVLLPIFERPRPAAQNRTRVVFDCQTEK